MNIQVRPDLAARLNEIAQREGIPVHELLERVLEGFFDSAAEPQTEWVRMTRQRLDEIWDAEDFSDWQPAHAG